jgi:hypothetical protein
LAILVVGVSACSGPGGATPAARLRGDRGGDDPYLEITGLGRDTVRALAAARPTHAQWTALLKVSTGPDAPPIAGAYSVAGGAVRFTPAYPFDRGRSYQVRLDRARLPASPAGEAGAPLVFTFERPAPNLAPSTVVTAVYPTARVAPENLLRMYIQFSAPMSERNGVRNLQLLDDRGQPVAAPFLPLDIGFWNPDHTRFTVFFDPGRVKLGVEENERMGRALQAGRSYTLVVARDWTDGNGLKLRLPFRQSFEVGAPETRPLDPKAWTVSPPPAGSRAPLVVSFSRPLDHGLLLSALGVLDQDGAVAGEAEVSPGEIEWRFTPDEPWGAGDYRVAVDATLEDAAGNQLGRPFEVDTTGGRRGPEPEPASLPFKVAAP